MAHDELVSLQAAHVINKLGGVAAVADMAHRDQSRVRRWTYSKAAGGTGGLIPADIQVDLMRKARERDLDLRPEDFFPDTQKEAAK